MLVIQKGTEQWIATYKGNYLRSFDTLGSVLEWITSTTHFGCANDSSEVTYEGLVCRACWPDELSVSILGTLRSIRSW